MDGASVTELEYTASMLSLIEAKRTPGSTLTAYTLGATLKPGEQWIVSARTWEMFQPVFVHFGGHAKSLLVSQLRIGNMLQIHTEHKAVRYSPGPDLDYQMKPVTADLFETVPFDIELAHPEIEMAMTIESRLSEPLEFSGAIVGFHLDRVESSRRCGELREERDKLATMRFARNRFLRIQQEQAERAAIGAHLDLGTPSQVENWLVLARYINEEAARRGIKSDE